MENIIVLPYMFIECP